MLGRVIELLSKETNAGYMWNTPEFCEFHVEKTGATFGSVSYTHLDVYKRQLYTLRAVCLRLNDANRPEYLCFAASYINYPVPFL